MRTTFACLVLGILSVLATPRLGPSQDTNKQVRDTPPEEGAGEFPRPLQHATSNLRDLERTGFLSVVSLEDRMIGNQGERGLVWTIKPAKTITFRHVQLILRQFRDVRLYVRQSTTLYEVHSTLLHHSQRIDLGASSGMVFSPDDEFEVWFYLDDSVRRRIAKRRVDLVVFRKLKR